MFGETFVSLFEYVLGCVIKNQATIQESRCLIMNYLF